MGGAEDCGASARPFGLTSESDLQFRLSSPIAGHTSLAEVFFLDFMHGGELVVTLRTGRWP